MNGLGLIRMRVEAIIRTGPVVPCELGSGSERASNAFFPYLTDVMGDAGIAACASATPEAPDGGVEGRVRIVIDGLCTCLDASRDRSDRVDLADFEVLSVLSRAACCDPESGQGAEPYSQVVYAEWVSGRGA
jgi:hypothetical protein